MSSATNVVLFIVGAIIIVDHHRDAMVATDNKRGAFRRYMYPRIECTRELESAAISAALPHNPQTRTRLVSFLQAK